MMAMFVSFIVLATAPAIAAASQTAGFSTFIGRVVGERHLQSSYVYLGCYAEGADRGLENAYRSLDMTVEACYGHCAEAGATYMGLQYGYECGCGYEEEMLHTENGPGTCDRPCLGDPSSSSELTCGGGTSFDLYSVGVQDVLATEAPTSTPTSSPTSFSSSDRGFVPVPAEFEDLLELHNEARCMHDTAALQWNDDTAEVARAHAEDLTSTENCGFLFNSKLDDHGFGENLFLCYDSTPCYSAEAAMNELYAAGVNDGPVTGYSLSTIRLLWQSTEGVGCAVGSCVTQGFDVSVLVCNYTPSGDYGDAEEAEAEVQPLSSTSGECQQFMDVATPAPSTAGFPAPAFTPAPFTTTTTASPSATFPPQSVPSTVAPVLSTASPTPSTPSPVEATSSPSDPAPEPGSTPAPVLSTTTAPVASPEEPSPNDGACSTTPCLNGGTCEVDPNGGYTCVCAGSYAGMTCETDTSSLPEFFITVDFIGTWTQSRTDVFQSAADRWAEILTHIPCTGTNGDGGSAGELVITATLESIDGPSGTLGFAGPRGIWNECQGISYSGEMTFDLDDIDDMESQGTFEGVILHEMGHVIGVGTLWGECSECDTAGDPEWKCPLAAEVYNDLAGNAADSPADIIELDGGEGTACGHFSEDTFDDELMTGYVNAGTMPLSKITTASLADRGYVVNPSMADEYTIPALRSPSARHGNTTTYEALDVDGADIEICDRDGNIVGTLPGKRFRF